MQASRDMLMVQQQVQQVLAGAEVGGVYSSLYATSVDHVAESVGAGGARAARVRNRTRKDGLGPLIEYRLHKLDRLIKFENTCYRDVSKSCTFHICSENISQCPFESVQ